MTSSAWDEHLVKAGGRQQRLPALHRAPQAEVALVRGGPRLRREPPQQRRQRARGLVGAQEAAGRQNVRCMRQRGCNSSSPLSRHDNPGQGAAGHDDHQRQDILPHAPARCKTSNPG